MYELVFTDERDQRGPLHTVIITALIHYSLHVADPSLCAAALEEIAPRIDGLPWAPALNDARRDYRATLDRAEAGSQ